MVTKIKGITLLNIHIWSWIRINVGVDVLVVYDGYGGLFCCLQLATQINFQVGLVVNYVKFAVFNLKHF